jgi:guanylate kinase
MSDVMSGKVVVLTAPSGAGKTTIAKNLLAELSWLRFSVSATTRPPRPDEVHGRDYYFLNNTTFDAYIKKGSFLEWEEFYNGRRYGTLRSSVEEQLKKGYFILFDVEVKGAVNLKNVFGDDCLSIFIKPPDMQTLKNRLLSRGTEDEASLVTRLQRAEMELQQAHTFDKVVVNDDFETAYKQVRNLVEGFRNAG